MTNIWETNQTDSYNQGKSQTSFTKWRVLVMDRVAELTGRGQEGAVQRLHERRLHQLGLDYDSGMTAEELAQEIAK